MSTVSAIAGITLEGATSIANTTTLGVPSPIRAVRKRASESDASTS